MDKGKHGFVGQKCAHTAGVPWTYGKYALRAFPCLTGFLLRQNCKAPASDGFSVIFGF